MGGFGDATERPAAGEVHVDAEDLLIGVTVAVDGEAVAAFGDPFLGGQLFGDGEHPAEGRFIFGRDIVHGGDFLVGDDEDVGGGNRVDVAEGGDKLILVDNVSGYFTRDNFGKNRTHFFLRFG